MYDELTPVDIKKIEEELDYRILTLRPKILEDVKTARGFGDLSENFEYKAAKQERGRNESRITCNGCFAPPWWSTLTRRAKASVFSTR